MTVAIRRGDSNDHPFILELGKQVAMSSVSSMRPTMRSLVEVSYEKLVEFVFRQSHTILIAHEGERRLGFLLLLDTLPDEVTMAPQAFVAYMAVAEDARRRGAGRALLAEAESLARKQGLPNIAMMVTEENEAARDLYEAAGYRTERRLLCKAL